MSYILEALKKAQAERQLGNAPTLHAPTLQSVDRSSAGARFKKPLLLLIVAMGVVIAALLAMVLKPAAAPANAPVVQDAAGAPAPAAQPALASAAPAVPSRAQAQAPAPVAADTPAPLPAPVAALPPPVATLTPAPRKHNEPPTAQAAPVLAANASASPAAAPGAPAKPAVAFEEPVQNLRDLPEPIQRSIPQVAVGGYIYSKNASDRLLLIDKVLRREGDEVAPGLKLEKLNPKEAVFNFKGYRYRVPY
jgi:general secretion pathway protein B